MRGTTWTKASPRGESNVVVHPRRQVVLVYAASEEAFVNGCHKGQVMLQCEVGAGQSAPIDVEVRKDVVGGDVVVQVEGPNFFAAGDRAGEIRRWDFRVDSEWAYFIGQALEKSSSGGSFRNSCCGGSAGGARPSSARSSRRNPNFSSLVSPPREGRGGPVVVVPARPRSSSAEAYHRAENEALDHMESLLDELGGRARALGQEAHTQKTALRDLQGEVDQASDRTQMQKGKMKRLIKKSGGKDGAGGSGTDLGMEKLLGGGGGLTGVRGAMAMGKFAGS